MRTKNEQAESIVEVARLNLGLITKHNGYVLEHNDFVIEHNVMKKIGNCGITY